MSSQWLALQPFCRFDLTQIRSTKARNKIDNAIEKKKRRKAKEAKEARKAKNAKKKRQDEALRWSEREPDQFCQHDNCPHHLAIALDGGRCLGCPVVHKP